MHLRHHLSQSSKRGQPNKWTWYFADFDLDCAWSYYSRSGTGSRATAGTGAGDTSAGGDIGAAAIVADTTEETGDDIREEVGTTSGHDRQLLPKVKLVYAVKR